MIRSPFSPWLPWIASLAALSNTALATNDGDWLGMNHGDVRNNAPVWNQALMLSDLSVLGIKIVREGLTQNNLVYDDSLVANYNSARVSPHNVIDFFKTTTTLYTVAEYKARCMAIMTRYNGLNGLGRVSYYIVGNEPDLCGLTPAQAVDFTRAAYEASRQVDPTGGIMVESAPTSSPETNFLRDMINLGVAEVCDYIGVHAYSSQIIDGRLSKPWQFQQQHGGTQKPVSCSEAGLSTTWNTWDTTFAQKNQWQADWAAQAYLQFKRYGYANVILFESSTESSWPGSFAWLRDSTPARNILTTSYGELQNHMNLNALTNAGFEAPNDYKHDWVISDDPSDGAWDTSRIAFQSAGGHTGSYAMKLDTSVAGRRVVRRVISVTPNQPVTLSAWVYSNNEGQGYLRAEGFNALDGMDEADNATGGTVGAWQKLTVSFTPTNSWAVIELSADADAKPGSYVKFDDVAVAPAGAGGGDLLSTNLDSASEGFYGSGQANGTIINAGAASVEQMNVVANATNSVEVITTGGADRALQFTDNSSTNTSNGIVSKAVSGLSTSDSGNNYVQLAYEFTPRLPAGTPATNLPTLFFLINSSGINPGGTVTAIQISMRGLNFSAITGGANPPAVALIQNHRYKVDAYLDLGSTTQDTWGYTLTDLTTSTVLDTRSGLLTRAPNIVPTMIVFNGNGNTTGYNASPYIAVDNPDVYIPEASVFTPNTMASTNFDGAALGLYGSGQPNSTLINPGLGEWQQLGVVANGTTNTVKVVSLGGTNRALQFTDNAANGSTDGIVSKALTGLSTNGGGNNYLHCRFDFSPLLSASGNAAPGLFFLVNSSGTGTGSAVTAVQVSLRGLSFSVSTGGTNPPAVTLVQSHVYRLEVALDTSSSTQDTWEYVLSDLTTGTVRDIRTGLLTRAPNIIPGNIVFNGNAQTTPANVSPFLWIDNLHVEASNAAWW
ncbi:MAG: hypothetical protein J0I10_00080 [Verrucomicrobia bacterium]|nr:hypothetical protein [Verrucomicrobiota bacterium]